MEQKQALEKATQDIELVKGQPIAKTFSGLWQLSAIYAKSGLLPKGIDTPERAFLAIQLGQEIGLSATQALQNIAVINGRATIWGDAMLGVVRASGLLQQFSETYEGEGEKLTAVCMVQRKGEQPVTQGFSVADAKRANLWGKQGPWSQYPMRMLKMRARSFALRDTFTDVLKGLYAREEIEDIVDVVATTRPTIEKISLPQATIDPTVTGNQHTATDTAPTEDSTPPQDEVPEAEPIHKRLGVEEQYVMDYINHLSTTSNLGIDLLLARAEKNLDGFREKMDAWHEKQAEPAKREQPPQLKKGRGKKDNTPPSTIAEDLEPVEEISEYDRLAIKIEEDVERLYRTQIKADINAAFEADLINIEQANKLYSEIGK